MTEVETSVTKTAYISPISVPMVTGKLEAKILKLLKKAQGAKVLKRGVPEVTKFLRKNAGSGGMVIFAGDVFPVELIAHMPILCEEKDVLYGYVSSRAVLAEAVGSKRLVSVVLVPKPAGSDSPYESVFTPCIEGLKAVHPFMGTGQMPDATPTKKRESEDGEEGALTEEPAKKKKKKEKKSE